MDSQQVNENQSQSNKKSPRQPGKMPIEQNVRRSLFATLYKSEADSAQANLHIWK